MGYSAIRLACFCAVFAFPIGFAAGCSGDAEGSGGSGGIAGTGGAGGAHALAGTWEGHLFPVSRGGNLTLSIDGSGEITEILLNGSAFPEVVGGEVDDGPEIYTMTWVTEIGPIAFPFLPDAEQVHAAIVPFIGTVALIGALERDGSPSTTFFESDVIGAWAGYGHAYDQAALDFVPFSPVDVDATAGPPTDFTVTMPSGTITGVLPDFNNFLAAWGGTAAVSGAQVIAVMSPDKQFVAVEVIPVGFSSLEDLTFFALNRKP